MSVSNQGECEIIACEFVGTMRCSAESDAIEICEVDRRGCLVWEVAEGCPSPLRCELADGYAACFCPHQCVEGESRCAAGNPPAIEECVSTADGCSHWQAPVACAAGQQCLEGEEWAECVD